MYQNITNIISSDIKEVDNKILQILFDNKNFLTQNFLQFILQGSKKLRSVAAILLLRALSTDVSSKQIQVCAISEIIHNASLIHDDIIDKADVRRGNKSFNNQFGNSAAVLSGDFLISVVLKELLKIGKNDVLEKYVNSFASLCKGEINQLAEKNQIISLEEYLEKTERKTAELFKTTFWSVFAVEDKTEYYNLAEDFGKSFGIAFQIRDDIRDFTQISSNKPSLSDFKNGICTLPMIIFAEEHNIKNFSEISLSDLQNSSAISKSRSLCNKFVNNALDLIRDFSDNQYAQGLKTLCEELKRI